MQTENKYLSLSLCFAIAVGGIAFSTYRSSPSQHNIETDLTILPASLTRAQTIGKNYESDPTLKRPYALVEFGDYQCPPCRMINGQIENFIAERKTKIGIAFRHFPLAMHPFAFKAALYAEAAREQGKFWQMHDLLYNSEGRLAPDDLERYAQQMKLNMPAFHKALETTAKARVRADLSAALDFNLSSTPSLLLCEPSGKVRMARFSELEDLIPR